MEGTVKADFIKGITTFKKRVSPSELMAAWKKGSYAHLMETIPWQDLPEDFDPFLQTLQKGVAGAADRTLELLPPNELRFDMNNPNIRNYVNEVTGRLVVGIQNDTMRVVQNQVQRSFTEALNVSDVADNIRDSIGLHPRYEQAVHNYESGLRADGVDPDKVDELTSSYRDRLLDSRARTVAKTETRQATNYGQLTVWQQAQSQGLVKQEAQKVWVTCKECITKTPSPCDLCYPMDGEMVPVSGFWTLADGSICEVPSDAHPNCNCGMTIDLGVDEGGEATEEEE